MARDTKTLERIVQTLIDHGVTANTAGLALDIVRTIRAGDDIGNGLRAIPIDALEEFKEHLRRHGGLPLAGVPEGLGPSA